MASEGADKNTKLRTPQLGTAAFIVKGALNKLYNTAITVGNKYETKIRGRVTVAYEGPKPAASDPEQLQDLVNKVINEARPIEVVDLDRAEAEAQYKKEPVAGQFIYEKKAPPASVTAVTVAKIADWTVCCSASKDFVATTREVGGIKILRFNHRENKQELEVCFELTGSTPEGSAPTEEKSTTAVVAAPTSSQPKTRGDDIVVVSDKLFEVFIQSLQKTQPELKFTPEELTAVKRASALQTSVLLTVLKNTAYATGFSAKQ